MVIVAIILPIVVVTYLSYREESSTPGREVAIGFDPVAAAKYPLSWVILGAVTAPGSGNSLSCRAEVTAGAIYSSRRAASGSVLSARRAGT
jgi:hypothetical protein